MGILCPAVFANPACFGIWRGNYFFGKWIFLYIKFKVYILIINKKIKQIVLPPWPFWNRNPLKWQKPVKKEAPKTN